MRAPRSVTGRPAQRWFFRDAASEIGHESGGLRTAACRARLAARSLVFWGAFSQRGSSNGVARRRTPATAIAVRGW